MNTDAVACEEICTTRQSWLLIIVMVQWSCTKDMDTCLNINDTTDVENVVLGVMLARPFVIVFVVDNLIATYVKHIAEVTSVFEEEGFQILTGMEMFVIFY